MAISQSSNTDREFITESTSPRPKQNHKIFARNIFILGFGTALAQALNIISTPVLSWYYSPESFGLMATVLSISYLCASLANLNYDTAIIMPQENSIALDLLFFCMICNIICSIFVYAVLMAVAAAFPQFPLLSLPFLPMLVAIGVFLLSTFNSLNKWAVRVEAYRDSSISQVIRTIVCLTIQGAGIFFNSAAIWLISGRLIGPAPGIAFLVLRHASDLLKINIKAQFRRSISAAVSYRRFPLFAAPQRVISLIAEELPTLTLATFFGAAAAGHYWFSNRLLQMPIGIISQAIGNVFYRDSARNVQEGGKIFPSSLKITFGLAAIAIIPVLTIVLWAPQIYSFFLGPDWQTAAVYAQWIVIWAFFRFTVSPIIPLFTVLNEQRLLLKLDSIVFFLRITMIAYCAIRLTAIDLVAALSIFESIKILAYCIVILRLAWIKDREEPVS